MKEQSLDLGPQEKVIKLKEKHSLSEKEILEAYGETLINVESHVGNAQWGVPSRSSGKSQLVTVKEAMKINDGTHWSASNEFVTITYDEDYGHEISLNN